MSTTYALSRHLDEFRTYFPQLESRKDVKSLLSVAESNFPTIKANFEENLESFKESGLICEFLEEDGWFDKFMANPSTALPLQERVDDNSKRIRSKKSRAAYSKDFELSQLPISLPPTEAHAIRDGVGKQLRLEAIRKSAAERLDRIASDPAVAATLVFVVFSPSSRLAKRLPMSNVELTIDLLLTDRYYYFVKFASENF